MTVKESAAIEKLTESVDALRTDVREVRVAIIGDVTRPADDGLRGRVRDLENAPAPPAPEECKTDRRRLWLAVKTVVGVLVTITGWLILNKL